MNSNVGLIVTARVGSKRLREKVLQKINGRFTIDILLDHVIPNDDLYTVVLAIPDGEDDDILASIGNSRGVIVYRGQNDSPLHRMYECALINEFDHIVRVTTDDILIDQTLLRNQLRFHTNGIHDYTFMAKCPEGVAGEIISFDALERVVKELKGRPVEFVSYYLRNKKFVWREYYPPSPGGNYQFSFRLTMDYEEDLTLLRVIFSCLREPFGTLDIINFLKQNKYLLNINKLPEVTFYTCNYNTSDYIIDCMASVVNQSFVDFEYFVIDDCSEDNSMNKIIEYYSKLPLFYQNKIRILRNEKNEGLPSCSNDILDIARGKYIIRVDSDDCITVDGVERMLDSIKTEGTEGCLSGYYRTGEHLSITSETLNNEWHPGCALLSKKCVNELKFKKDLEYLEGREFFMRFNDNFSLSFLPEPLWYYRSRPGQKTQEKEHPDNG